MDMSGAGGNVTTITGLTTTNYTITPIEGDTYYYRVQAVGADGASEWSDWMDVDVAAIIDKLSFPLSSEENDGAVYDLTGRRLQQVPQRGVYIRDGKTYIAR